MLAPFRTGRRTGILKHGAFGLPSTAALSRSPSPWPVYEIFIKSMLRNHRLASAAAAQAIDAAIYSP